MPLKRPLHRLRGTWRDQQVRGRIGAARAARAARLGAVAAGLRAPEVAIVECRTGPDVSGLFSEVAAVVGFLDHYERWQGYYAGVRVSFADGLYYDPGVGPNWWNYYFEPIDIGGGRGAPERIVNPHYHDLCANRVERWLSRPAAAALVERYVLVQPAVGQQADAFVSSEWRGHMVGVHYRGTDKWEDAPRVAYEQMAAVIREAMSGRPDSRIFLATDEAAFVDYLEKTFPGRVASRPMFRSVDGRPIDVVNTDRNYRKGLDAVLDCLLLSRTHFLIRTASNLSLCATLFNARLPGTLLNPER